MVYNNHEKKYTLILIIIYKYVKSITKTVIFGEEIL